MNLEVKRDEVCDENQMEIERHRLCGSLTVHWPQLALHLTLQHKLEQQW